MRPQAPQRAADCRLAHAQERGNDRHPLVDQEVVEHDQQVQVQFGDVHAVTRPFYLIFKF
jgi:hypothetical protein